MRGLCLRLVRDDAGVETVEAALMLLLVTIACYLGYQALGACTRHDAEDAAAAFLPGS